MVERQTLLGSWTETELVRQGHRMLALTRLVSATLAFQSKSIKGRKTIVTVHSDGHIAITSTNLIYSTHFLIKSTLYCSLEIINLYFKQHKTKAKNYSECRNITYFTQIKKMQSDRVPSIYEKELFQLLCQF